MDNVNYNLKQKEIIKSLDGKKSLLMQVCCAPCSTACIERLYDFFDITLLFYNPNMDTKEEFDTRKDELLRFIKEKYNESVKVIVINYDHSEFLNAVKGHEQDKELGERCTICYAQRLRKTAELAKSGGYDFFTTTLSVSPYKDSKRLNKIGYELEKLLDTKYLCADFKKEGGYYRSCELSKEYNLYRQDYCGCEFSKEKKEG